MEIKQAMNGFIYTNNYGDVYVYKSLTELAAAIEGSQDTRYVSYAPGKGTDDLIYVRSLAKNGEKIKAIKELRATFVPTLYLKEAKELIEILCSPS